MPGHEFIGRDSMTLISTAINRARVMEGRSSAVIVWLIFRSSARAFARKVEEVCVARCVLVEGGIKSIKNACHNLSDYGRPRSLTPYSAIMARTSHVPWIVQVFLAGNSLCCW